MNGRKAAIPQATLIVLLLPLCLSFGCAAALAESSESINASAGDPPPKAPPAKAQKSDDEAQSAASAPQGGVQEQALVFEKRDRVRIVLVGDTGLPNEKIRAVAQAIRTVPKDYVLLAGDIAYPEAPPCYKGELTEAAREVLDRSLGDFIEKLGAPVLLLLGNHDVGHQRSDPAREACILRYAAEHEKLYFPELSWSLDLGVVSLVGLNTNALDDAQAEMARSVLKSATRWRLLSGHHVYRTYQDKANERIVRPWIKKHKLRADMFLNAHAHLHQFGIYDGVLAVTSGATALPRERPECPGKCGRGQKFGSSKPGFALLDFSADKVVLSFYDTTGSVLYTTTQKRRSAGR